MTNHTPHVQRFISQFCGLGQKKTLQKLLCLTQEKPSKHMSLLDDHKPLLLPNMLVKFARILSNGGVCFQLKD